MQKDEMLPLGALNIAEFRELLREELECLRPDEKDVKKKITEDGTADGRHFVYGLRGIQRLFNVSHKTAQHYKDHIIRDAVYQNGRTIVVDADMAMDLFNRHRKKQ